jgi:uncharacterized membrane protein YhaH (DUF805 family)
MTRAKFGKYFFYFTLILSLVIMGLGIILKPQDETVEAANIMLRSKNILSFLAFGFILPLGLIIREYLSVVHDSNKMRMKALMALAVLVGGLVILIFVKGVTASYIVLYVSLFSLIYILVPTKSNENRKV